MPRAPEATGSVLDGRYELHAVVGEGAFGRVYRGRDRRLDRIVAVKVIKPWWAEDPAWADAFEREARILARVSDPGIVQIFDVGQAREGLYYVAELIDGESLAARLKRRRLTGVEACDIAEQLARAVGRAHGQRIVHRDIKPANVLMSASGQVKLGDFGVARLAEGSTGGTAGGVVGTPRYMAPEQARGHRTSPATDVYAVGVVLYEMLAGRPPFSGDSAIELALCHLQDPPPPLPAGTPAPLDKIVARALSKDPRNRYRDGREMAAALARARPTLSSQPPRPTGHSHSLGAAAEPEPTRVAPKMGPRRNVNPSARRRSAALLGLVCLLLVAMILAAVLLAPPARERVPQLSGLSKAAAAARLHRAHLRSAFAARFDAAASGRVIGQSPSARRFATEGSTVRVVVSQGPPPVEVPRLVGQSSSSARGVLSSLGLNARVSVAPAPGTQPGTVTGQSPVGGRYVRTHSNVALTVAETPHWRPLTSFAGSGGGSSVAFRIRGEKWRISYRMTFAGTCTLIFFCDGPSASVVRVPASSAVADFGMNDGAGRHETVRSGPGVYQVRVVPGSDSTRWSVSISDYY